MADQPTPLPGGQALQQGLADLRQTWEHLARELAPGVPELPGVIDQELCGLSSSDLNEETLIKLAESVVGRVANAGYPDEATALFRRMGRAMYELLLLLATDAEVREMGGGGEPPAPPAVAPPPPAPRAQEPVAAGPEPWTHPLGSFDPRPSRNGLAVAPAPQPRPEPGIGAEPAAQLGTSAEPAAGGQRPPRAKAKPKAPSAPASPAVAPPLAAPAVRMAAPNGSAPVVPARPGVPPSPAPATAPLLGPAAPMSPAALPPTTVPPPPLAPAAGNGSAAPSGAQPAAPRPPAPVAAGPSEEDAPLWGFDPSTRESEPAEVVLEPVVPDPVPAGVGAAVEAVPAAPAAPNRWQVRVSPKVRSDRERKLSARQGQLAGLIEEILATAGQQQDALSARGQARRALTAAQERPPLAEGMDLAGRVQALLEEGEFEEAATLAVQNALTVGGEAGAAIACTVGEAIDGAKHFELAILCFTTAVLSCPPFDRACWGLCNLAVARRDPVLAPVWLEFIARLLRARGADGEAIGVYRELLRLSPRRGDIRDLLRLSSLTGVLPD